MQFHMKIVGLMLEWVVNYGVWQDLQWVNVEWKRFYLFIRKNKVLGFEIKELMEWEILNMQPWCCVHNLVPKHVCLCLIEKASMPSPVKYVHWFLFLYFPLGWTKERHDSIRCALCSVIAFSNVGMREFVVCLWKSIVTLSMSKCVFVMSLVTCGSWTHLQ